MNLNDLSDLYERAIDVIVGVLRVVIWGTMIMIVWKIVLWVWS